VDDAGLVALELGGLVVGVADHDDAIAGLHQPGGGAVEAHVARAPPAADRVGLEPGAVVDVDDGNLLVLEDVGGLQQVGIDGDRAHVVQVGVGDRGAVDLRLEHATTHGRATS
jgi:hypothetical protein